jgi:hypothetical protein
LEVALEAEDLSRQALHQLVELGHLSFKGRPLFFIHGSHHHRILRAGLLVASCGYVIKFEGLHLELHASQLIIHALIELVRLHLLRNWQLEA